MKHKVSFTELCENPIRISLDPQIVIRVNGKFMNWAAAGPILLAIQAFKQPLTRPAVSKLDDHIQASLNQQSSYSYRRAISSWFSRTSTFNLKEVFFLTKL
jgi:hypothetical protein